MNRSILCNYDIEAKSNFPLESQAACDTSKTKTDLVMYFTVNLAFVNYFDRTIKSLGILILRNWTTKEQISPFSVESFEINASLLNLPKTLKGFVNQYKNKKKILELQEHIDEERSKQSFKFWFFPQQFSSRYTHFLSGIDNYNYNISGNLYGMQTVETDNFVSKHSLTVCQRDRSSRLKVPRHSLYA